MYPFGERERGVNRQTRDILLIVIFVLVALNVLQFVFRPPMGARNLEIKNALVARVRADIESARIISAQLSRTGGTSTQRQLSETRQYLYAVTQLNELTSTLFGGGQTLVPQDTVNLAMHAVDACETRRQEGLALDTPLSELWQLIKDLDEAAVLI